jgi:hypothetical protein
MWTTMHKFWNHFSLINNNLELHVVCFGFGKEVVYNESHLQFLNMYMSDVNKIVGQCKTIEGFEPIHHIF